MRFLFSLILLGLGASSALAQGQWFGPTTLDDLRSRPRVSLVFASQDEVSPLSYFGHTFLVFHREQEPEIDAPIVEFLGQTQGIDGVAWKALFASIPGRYQMQRFLYKRRAYDQENRDLWIYTLKLSDAERSGLLRNLEGVLEREHPYQFTRKNCGAYIEALLPFAEEQTFFTLPMKTLQTPLLRERVERVQVILAQRTQGRLSQDPADLLRFQYGREADPGARQAIYAALKQQPAATVALKTDDPAQFSGRRRLGYQYHAASGPHLLIAPYAQDFYTAPREVPAGSVLRILQSDFVLAPEGWNLHAVDIFHMEAMAPADAWSDGLVRLVEFAYQRDAGWRLRWGTGWAANPWDGALIGVRGFGEVDVFGQKRWSWQGDLGGMLYAEERLGRDLRVALEYEQTLERANWELRLSYALRSGWTVEAAGNDEQSHAGLIVNF